MTQCPDSLQQWQSQLLACIQPGQQQECQPECREPSLVGIKPEDPARLDCYRTTVREGLLQSLQLSYPQVKQQLGQTLFRQLAFQYVMRYPSVSCQLNDYGQFFPQFLGNHIILTDYPWLADLALMDWLMQCSYYAADQAPIATEHLQAIEKLDAQYQSALCFHLRADIFVLRSRYSLLNPGLLDVQGQQATLDGYLVIYRQQMTVHSDPISSHLFSLMQAMSQQKTLGEMLANSVDISLLTGVMQRGWIHRYSLADNTAGCVA